MPLVLPRAVASVHSVVLCCSCLVLSVAVKVPYLVPSTASSWHNIPHLHLRLHRYRGHPPPSKHLKSLLLALTLHLLTLAPTFCAVAFSVSSQSQVSQTLVIFECLHQDQTSPASSTRATPTPVPFRPSHLLCTPLQSRPAARNTPPTPESELKSQIQTAPHPDTIAASCFSFAVAQP